MKRHLITLGLLSFAAPVYAETGAQALGDVKQCIMQNDPHFCHAHMTPDSYEVFDKFVAYKLMPCVPTDFTYESEQNISAHSVVTARIAADNKTDYRFKLLFVQDGDGLKVDIPETLRTGLGEKWRDKLNLSEQLFLMMKQNMQDKLTCDVLRELLTPEKAGGRTPK